MRTIPILELSLVFIPTIFLLELAVSVPSTDALDLTAGCMMGVGSSECCCDVRC